MSTDPTLKRKRIAPSRSRLLVVALLAVLALVAAACGDDSDADTADESSNSQSGSTSDSSSATGSGSSSEPSDDAGEAASIAITHKFGTTDVPADPDRVVSVGFSDQDDLLALGVIPVGIRDWFGDQPSAVWPWAQSALGSAEPTVIPSDELNIEAVAALEPDLIIGVSSGMTEDEYGLLSSIAPTVAQSGDYPDFGMPWQERSRLIGESLGKLDEANALISAVEERFADARADNPGFEGASAAVAFVFTEQPGAYASTDVRARIMSDLGFVTPPEYDELAGDSFFASFSAERIDLLDTDVLVWITSTQEEIDGITQSPLRDGLAAVRDGREVFADTETTGAFSFASPLSLGFLLDQLVPELALAVDGDPATVVPSAVAVGAVEDGGSDEPSGDAAEPTAVWETVFDTSIPFADKVAYIENGADYADEHEAYVATGDALGGISVVVDSATVDGDVADLVYAIAFNGNPVYTEQEASVNRVDDTWIVTEDTFCGFLESARTPCG
ncbi:MAG: iron-siderophore ABC transporter substrate-binding protein [Actinomycetota bacterium]